jgi:hypothetical protein
VNPDSLFPLPIYSNQASTFFLYQSNESFIC